MMTVVKMGLAFCIYLVWFGCTHDPKIDQVDGPFYFDSNKTSLKWTAYKYSTKLGVSGILPDVRYKPSHEWINNLSHITDFITGFYFECVVNLTPNENASVRDQNIQNYFFNKLSTTKIYGKVISASGTATSGLVSMELTFNGVQKIYHASYLVSGNIIALDCTIQLKDFNALEALSSLHEAVSDLHKGPDGISITWPDVDIKVSTELVHKKMK